jgi:hypothetical protein
MTILPELQRELATAARRVERPKRRWFRRALVLVPVGIVAIGGLAYAAAKTFTGDDSRPYQYQYGTCPKVVLPLGPAALPHAMRAAVLQARAAYSTADLGRTYAVDAHVVTKGSVRSVDAEKCGLLGKTVLVDLHLPAPFHSASMSEGAVYVSLIRQPDGSASYQVWGIEH